MKKDDFIQRSLRVSTKKEQLEFSTAIVSAEFIYDLKRELGFLNKKDNKDAYKALAKKMKISLRELTSYMECEKDVTLEFVVKLMWATSLRIRFRITKK